jgi:hypothetical protein
LRGRLRRGSPLDSAKAIAMLARHGGAMADYKAPHVQDEPGLPVIAIPTTAGTGSEATRVTVITDEATDEKMMCPGLAYLPVAALVDYELTFTKPRRLTADTGIDSLTTRSRPMSRSAPARSPMAWRCWRCARSRPTCAAPATIPMTAQRARR